MRDLRAIAVDQAGYQQTSATVASRRVDNTLPAVSLADPGRVPDRHQDADARPARTATASARWRSSTAPPAGRGRRCAPARRRRARARSTRRPLADGSYELRARATDAAGNVNDSTLTRVVDNNAPTGSIPAPGPLAGTVSVDITAADGNGSGIASVTGQFRPQGSSTWTTVCVDVDAVLRLHEPRHDAVPGRALRVAGDHRRQAPASATRPRRSPSGSTTPRRTTATLANPGSILTGTKALSGTAADAGSGVAVVDRPVPHIAVRHVDRHLRRRHVDLRLQLEHHRASPTGPTTCAPSSATRPATPRPRP